MKDYDTWKTRTPEDDVGATYAESVEALNDLVGDLQSDIRELVDAKLKLQSEVSALRDEVERARPVVAAARAWRQAEHRSRESDRREGELWSAVDEMEDKEYDREQRRLRREEHEAYVASIDAKESK